LLAGGSRRIGETVRICDPLGGAEISAQVCRNTFYDPEGSRVRA